MKWLLGFLNIRNEIKVLRDSVDETVINHAYNTRIKEIESLRKYDRGEKHIDAPNLRNFVRSI